MVSMTDLLLSIGDDGLGTGVVPLSISSSAPAVRRSCDDVVGGEGVEMAGGVGVVTETDDRALSSNSA